MTKWRKTAWWIAGGLTIFLLLCALALHSLFDKTHLTELARDHARAAWSRDLLIGDLSLQLMPYPAVHAADVTLSNASWAHSKNLLEAGRITARLELLPLLGGQVRISALSIDGLKANPEVSSDGRKSWDIHDTGAARTGTAKAEAVFDPTQLTALRLQNAQIGYWRNGTAKTWHIDELDADGQSGWRNVRIDARMSRDGYPLEVNGQFADLSGIGIQGAVSEGALQLKSNNALLMLAGRIPLEAGLQNHAVKARLEATSLKEMLGFFGIGSGPVASVKARVDLLESKGRITAANLEFNLGKLTLSGDAQLALSGAKPAIDARIAVDRLDWVQALQDAGYHPVPPKPAGELFRTDPLDWPLLVALQDVEGTLDADIRSLKLRSGIELKNAKAHFAFDGDRLSMSPFSANLLGGSASGNMQLYGTQKKVRLDLDATDISLEQWFAEAGKKNALTGGPMKISAAVSASGNSMKELAASLTGPVTIRMGRAKIRSGKVQQAETLLTGLIPMFSAGHAEQVDLECVGARLPFIAGRAAARPIAGMRSDASQLLTYGYVDLQRQTFDLRGRIKARSGISVGVSMLTGDVKIAGKINRPEASLDPSGTPEALARIGAAIVTGGISLLGTAIWDAASPASDPCQIVFAADNARRTIRRTDKNASEKPRKSQYAGNNRKPKMP
ncbi:MAG: hypothetical protein JWQ21_3458 [Herminiimonas sp.]|nr:hypothetical protein [Herminiimonas sp.]